MKRSRRHLATLLAAAIATGCSATAPADSTGDAAAVPGYVTDTAAFDQFIATRPTPEQFRSRYPDVTLVLPGEIATKELRMNHSRYFPRIDAQGRITGGDFR